MTTEWSGCRTPGVVRRIADTTVEVHTLRLVVTTISISSTAHTLELSVVYPAKGRRLVTTSGIVSGIAGPAVGVHALTQSCFITILVTPANDTLRAVRRRRTIGRLGRATEVLYWVTGTTRAVATKWQRGIVAIAVAATLKTLSASSAVDTEGCVGCTAGVVVDVTSSALTGDTFAFQATTVAVI